MKLPTNLFAGTLFHTTSQVLAFTFAACLAIPARAEVQPLFDLTVCTDRADLIAIGKLAADGTFTIEQLLAGEHDTTTPIQLSRNYAADLIEAMRPAGEPIVDALVFLDKNYRPVWDNAAVVGLDGKDVFLIQPPQAGILWLSGAKLKPTRHQTLTRDVFLLATRLTIAQTVERRRLAALPASEDRARQVLTFLERESAESDAAKTLTAHPDYHLQQLAVALRPVHRGEESVLLGELTATNNPAWRIRLLKLVAGVPLSNNAFEIAATWIAPEHPQELREVAVAAITQINDYWASERLLPLLSLDDPAFAAVLGGIGRRSDEFYRWRRNPKSVDALLKLMEQLRLSNATQDAARRDDLSYHILAAVHYHLHPRLLPALVEWASRAEDSTSWRACSALRDLTRLECTPKNLGPLIEWWREARPILEADFDLSRPEGISAWLDAYQSADKTTKDILARMWLYERTIPEEYLFGEARSDTEERAATAQAVLAMLWQFDRLTPEIRESIVEEFMPLELVEVQSPLNATGGRELKLIGDRKFAFPDSAWTEFRTEWTMSDMPQTIGGGGDSWNSRSLGGEGEIALGSLGGGRHPGEPTVSAVFFMRQYDHRTREVVWTHRWEFGPKKLRMLPDR